MRLGRRVVITGIGLITPLGVGTEPTWSALLEGRSGVGPITRFDASDFSVQIAGEVTDFDPLVWVAKKEARHMDRFIHFAIAAAQLAFDDAGLSTPLPNPERCGALIGVGLGGLESLELAAKTLAERGPRRLSPFMIPQLIANLAPGNQPIPGRLVDA